MVSSAIDALLAVEEREIQRAISNIVILNTPLIVLLYKVIDGLIAEDPVGGVDVALENGWTEYNGTLAFGICYFLDAVYENSLFSDVSVYHVELIVLG